MKQLTYIILLCTLVIFSCAPKDDVPNPVEEHLCSSQDSFYMNGILNGEEWNAKTVFRRNAHRNRLSIFGFKAESTGDYDVLYMSVFKEPFERRTPSYAYFNFVYGVDSGYGRYHISEQDSARNWVEITHLDEEANIVEGKFEVLLRIDTDMPNPYNEPDSIEVRLGCFQSRITDTTY